MDLTTQLITLYDAFEREIVQHMPHYNDSDFSFENFIKWLRMNQERPDVRRIAVGCDCAADAH